MITKNKNTSGPARFDLSVRFPWKHLIEMIFESLLPESKMPDASMFRCFIFHTSRTSSFPSRNSEHKFSAIPQVIWQNTCLGKMV
jgi:hypothetical protein